MNLQQILILFCVLFSACTKLQVENGKNEKNINLTFFLFKDISGEYIVKRELIESKNQLINRQSLFTIENPQTPLEKTVTVMKFGTIGKQNTKRLASRPTASQHSIWFEQKEFFSQMKLDIKKKNMEVYLKSPEEKWNGKKYENLPKTHRFCWFSQIPECVKKLFKLQTFNKEPQSFIVVWDNFPYHNEQLQNMSGSLFSNANIAYDGDIDNTHRFAVSFDGQVILYHYDKNFVFEKMFWIAQGIAMVKDLEKR
jgi:hypothetical protein